MKFLKILMICMLPLSLFAWKMESGTAILPEVTVGSNSWKTITLQQEYSEIPLIFALINEGSGYSSDTPTALRIRNITTTSFEVVQVEPQSSVGDTEGEHPEVNIHYIAIEAGNYTLSDGTHILAETIDTAKYQGRNASGTKDWDSVTFSSSFSDVPIVTSMIQTLNNEVSTLPGASSSPWMTVAMKNVDENGLDITLDRAETSTEDISVNETVAYLVLDADVQGTLYESNCTQVKYETILTSDSVRGWDNDCYDYSFVNTYTALPNVIGSQETRDGADGGWLRRCNLTNSEVGVAIEEDQSSDSERAHTTEIVGLAIFEKDFIYDSLLADVCIKPVLNFKMDECYWMGGANGVTDDVKDSSGNEMHGQSRNKADNIEADAKICRAGKLVNTYADSNKSDAVYYPNNTQEEANIGKNVPFSISAWVYRNDDNKWMAAVVKVSDDSWTDGWGLIHTKTSGFWNPKYLEFFVGDYKTYARTQLDTDIWIHIVGTYDGNTIKIYKNGVLENSKTQDTYTAGALPLSIGDDISGSTTDDRWQGAIDEVKVWNRVLTDSEIDNIYNNENSGLNYDGSIRECKACNGSSIEANSWDLIGVPADSRDVDITVDELFGDDMNGTYKDDWILYKRTYSSTDNSSGYKVLELNSTLDFGQSYWLGSKLDNEWYVDGTPEVDYNSSSNACTAEECVEIDLTSASVDFEVDGDDGSGPYRYNMSGFTDMIKPVDWADCRFLIDGTAYTPTDANESGYANKQIWLYNGTGTDKSNSYTTCDDTMNCKLEPFKGFWIELHGSTKGKTVKLLIPKG